MSDAIWKGDQLERKQDYELIVQDLFHRNALAVARQSGAVSTNIDAAWGMGKTFFIKRFREQLEADGSKAVYIDAWQDDSSDDPLNAIMSPMLDAVTTSKVSSGVKKNLKSAAGSIVLRSLKGLATTGAGLLIGRDNAEGIADDAIRIFAGATIDEAEQIADAALDEFKRSKETISKFKLNFSEAVEKLPNRPLFVLIDELDRCRPTYAVKLLERVKHLFDIPNIAFVFSTNTEQLTHTIRAVYGDSFDAVTYLRRFFDRTYQLQALANLTFIKGLWERYALSSERFTSLRNIEQTTLIDYCGRAFGLSLRDLEQCHEILYTVEANSNPKLTMPLGFLFVLIILYQQGKYEAFEGLERSRTTTLFTVLPEPDRARIARQPSLIFRTPGKLREDHGAGTGRIDELFDQFRQMADDITNEVEGSAAIAQMVEAYRSEEFRILHNNTYNEHDHPKSILLKYFGAIRRAAKFT